MISLISGIYAGMLTEYQKKWNREKEKKEWQQWEDGERMKEEFGHVVSIEPIPKRKVRSKNTRPKHLHK